MKSTGKTDKAGADSSLLRSVASRLSSWQIPHGSRILVAFSGGPDSTALVGALNELEPEWGFRLCCAFLDHGIRPEPERKDERHFVETFAKRLGCKLVRGDLEPGRIVDEARSTGAGVEDTARRYRYEFLRKEAGAFRADFIALGHTLDDQAETMVMRFFQGSGAGGLSGIPGRRGDIIRPLIGVPRTGVLEYLDSRGYGYRVDSSNMAPDYLRNRVRLSLVPAAEKLFPGFRASLSSLASRMEEMSGYLDDEAMRKIKWTPSGRSLVTDRAMFFDAPPVLRIQAVYGAFHRVTGRPDFRLPLRFLNPVRTVGNGPGDRILVRGYGFILRTAGSLIFAEEDIVIDPKTGYSIPIDIVENESTRSIPGLFSVDVRTGRSASYGGDDPWVFQDSIRPPLVIRSRRTDDTLLTGYGRKSVSKLLSEWKIPVALRPRVPVLEDAGGVLCVLGSPFGYRNRFRERCTGSPLPDRIIKIFSIQIYGV